MVKEKFMRNKTLMISAVLAAVSFCSLHAQEAPAKGDFALGVYGTGSIPIGTYSDYVKGSFGGGALAEWTLPFSFGNCIPGIILCADGCSVITCADAADGGWSSCILAGFDVRCPLGSRGLFVVPALGFEYTFVPPTQEDCQHILGARLGILWRPGHQVKTEVPEPVEETKPVV